MYDTAYSIKIIGSVILAYSAFKTLRWFLNYWKLVNRISSIPTPLTMFPVLGNAHQLETGPSSFINLTFSNICLIKVVSNIEFYQQIKNFATQFKDKPFYLLWLGPHPNIVFTKAESVEVCF